MKIEKMSRGVMTGSAEVTAGADFSIKGSVRVNRFMGPSEEVKLRVNQGI